MLFMQAQAPGVSALKGIGQRGVSSRRQTAVICPLRPGLVEERQLNVPF